MSVAHALLPDGRKDDGYDITDFYGVDPRLGTHGDFVELVRTARASGLRVVIDFVMNHTSDAHPWFKSARRSKDGPNGTTTCGARPSPSRAPRTSSFPTRRPASGNSTPRPTSGTCTTSTSTNPTSTSRTRQCRKRFHAVGFWLELGVSGFRVDAVPFLFAKDAAPGTPGVFDPNEYLGDVRNFVTRRVGDAVLLGEVNLPYKDQKAFFGGPDGDGLNMQFDFIGMQNLYLRSSAATAVRSPRPCGSDRSST